jgi:hypothetical protein
MEVPIRAIGVMAPLEYFKRLIVHGRPRLPHAGGEICVPSIRVAGWADNGRQGHNDHNYHHDG